VIYNFILLWGVFVVLFLLFFIGWCFALPCGFYGLIGLILALFMAFWCSWCLVEYIKNPDTDFST
jgi:hypothetical protein